MYEYIRTYKYIYILIYMHTYIQEYISTYIHRYMHVVPCVEQVQHQIQLLPLLDICTEGDTEKESRQSEKTCSSQTIRISGQAGA